ncbi:hypothetical protein [Desulfosarcina sp.]|uniref:hypothetical protein n=1 Tax=Desulfosarcina sp. TaxID=2027861 RepID=UPI0029B9055D|nr:hypothetical protein [Desulfosarcina sp.]MDX2455189.1 hypothetical protein [Desulfosarcina sp.]MDX2492734.1 hypothetical protein [Desulfosarcina sp.]
MIRGFISQVDVYARNHIGVKIGHLVLPTMPQQFALWQFVQLFEFFGGISDPGRETGGRKKIFRIEGFLL